MEIYGAKIKREGWTGEEWEETVSKQRIVVEAKNESDAITLIIQTYNANENLFTPKRDCKKHPRDTYYPFDLKSGEALLRTLEKEIGKSREELEDLIG